MSKLNFVKSVMAVFTGGDEGKVTRFQNRYVKANKDQISTRKREIEDLNDQMADLEEKAKDDMLGVDMEQIKSVENTKEYIVTYRAKQVANIKAKKAMVEAVEALEEEIKMFTELNDMVS